jgi:L,D-peptidoglycan transpeptidase YkuD (ErfK/YbiS/YcfS/YnhG family)
VEGLRGIFIRQLFVRVLSCRATTGTLVFGNLRFPCALGRGGCKSLKREGDGATPIGRFPLLSAYFRPDRHLRPRTGLPLRITRQADGWCDAPADRNYNRPVRHPYPASAERMWRADPLYDVVVVLGYNDRPRIAGRGSAVFLHVASDAGTPTEGCVALRRTDLIRLLPLLGKGARLRIRS